MDPLFAKTRAFTDVEVELFGYWTRADKAALDATPVLDSGLYLEHLLSQLDANAEAWTPEQVAEHDRAVKVYAAEKAALEAALTAAEQAHQDRPPLTGEGQGTGEPTSGEGGYGGSGDQKQ